MIRFFAAFAVLLACVPLSVLSGVAVFKLSGENWAMWTTGPHRWGLPAVGSRNVVRLRGPDRRTAQSRRRPQPQVDQSTAWERRCGSDRRQVLGAA